MTSKYIKLNSITCCRGSRLICEWKIQIFQLVKRFLRLINHLSRVKAANFTSMDSIWNKKRVLNVSRVVFWNQHVVVCCTCYTIWLGSFFFQEQPQPQIFTHRKKKFVEVKKNKKKSKGLLFWDYHNLITSDRLLLPNILWEYVKKM
jgi:hypothetical protein